jgi:hypothetical protein
MRSRARGTSVGREAQGPRKGLESPTPSLPGLVQLLGNRLQRTQKLLGVLRALPRVLVFDAVGASPRTLEAHNSPNFRRISRFRFDTPIDIDEFRGTTKRSSQVQLTRGSRDARGMGFRLLRSKGHCEARVWISGALRLALHERPRRREPTSVCSPPKVDLGRVRSGPSGLLGRGVSFGGTNRRNVRDQPFRYTLLGYSSGVGRTVDPRLR